MTPSRQKLHVSKQEPISVTLCTPRKDTGLCVTVPPEGGYLFPLMIRQVSGKDVVVHEYHAALDAVCFKFCP